MLKVFQGFVMNLQEVMNSWLCPKTSNYFFQQIPVIFVNSIHYLDTCTTNLDKPKKWQDYMLIPYESDEGTGKCSHFSYFTRKKRATRIFQNSITNTSLFLVPIVKFVLNNGLVISLEYRSKAHYFKNKAFLFLIWFLLSYPPSILHKAFYHEKLGHIPTDLTIPKS